MGDPEIFLTITEQDGNQYEVKVESRRFTIGRSPDNDLPISNSALSRRHAIIEYFDGVPQITDCGSGNGTEVNGWPLAGPAVLHDGDRVLLGGACDLLVRIPANTAVTPAPEAQPPAPRKAQVQMRSAAQPAATPGASPNQSASNWLQMSVIAALAVVGLLLVVVLVAFMINRNGGLQANNNRRLPSNSGSPIETATPDATGDDASPSPNDNGSGTGSTNGVGNVSEDEIESSAEQVMAKLSSDDKVYGFPDKALRDIGAKIEAFRNDSSVPSSLRAMRQASAGIVTQAQREGIEPGLVIYTTLTELNTGRTGGDPGTVARAVMPQLLGLRATFGTNDADSSLILLAAYKMGTGEKRSHPLLVTIRRLVKNPLTQRNIWYLNERSGLDAQSYGFVTSLLALAVISRSPAQFGVQAEPLLF
jgi:FHA domain